MKYRYAQIDQGTVVSVFESSKPSDAANLVSWEEGSPPALGATYDAQTGTFTPPPAKPDGAPDFPRATKTEFRALLTQNQKLVWDNYDLLKATLGLTDEQFMAMRTFRADFELANVVDLTDDLMTQGLQTISSWGLQFGGGDLFPASEVERILEGRLP